MYGTRKITADLTWIGGNDRRISLFEGVYPVPQGMAYNAYLLTDEKTVLFDTVDRAVSDVFFENLAHALGGRRLDYVVVHHAEPDHSATLDELLRRCPGVYVVCTAKCRTMLEQFLGHSFPAITVADGYHLPTGRRNLTFLTAPMVHWPEVMATYDDVDGVLFSADAFGTFGAQDGALFADEVDFFGTRLAEARRYYTNIVGKYGTQTTALLQKAAALKIRFLCPLHGFVFRRQIGDILEKYRLWAHYEPEERGVLIAYASVYGHTAQAAEHLAIRLREHGVPTVLCDVSVTHASYLIADCFRFGHLVFAATTYNAGVFVRMEALLRELIAHNLQNRSIYLIENGTWAPTAAGQMKAILEKGRDIRFPAPPLTIRSALPAPQAPSLDALADAIADGMTAAAAAPNAAPAAAIDSTALFRISYGLYVLTARENGFDNGCIVNTAQLLTSDPLRFSVTVNKQNHTHDMILRTGLLNLSVLTEEAVFPIFERFGFRSGRDTDKFAGDAAENRTENGLRYLTEAVNAVISGRVVETHDFGTHTLFVAEVTGAARLSDAPSATYDYYFAHIKPKPQPVEETKKGFVCRICGYVYEGDTLPDDFVCPLCKHGAEDFEKLK